MPRSRRVRRRLALLTPFALMALTATLAHAQPADVAVPDWCQWRGPDRDGIVKETTWVSAGRDAPLWRRDVGRGYSNVCLREGRLVTHGYDETAEQDVIVCLDPLTGTEHWRYAYPSRLWDDMHEGGTLTTPVAEGDRVFVLSRLGTIRCLRLDDGVVAWERDLAKELGISLGSFGLPASPLILDEGLVLNVGPTLMLDKTTGATIWQTRDYGYSYSVPVDFMLEGRPMLAVFNAEGLTTIVRRDGAEGIVFPWPSQYNVNCASPIVIGSRVFISTGYSDKGCAMLELAGGGAEALWQSKVMRSKMTGCVLVGDHLYGFDSSMLKCIDLEGNELWRERGLGVGTLLVSADGRVVVLSESGELVVAEVSPEGFRELSRRTVFDDGTCWTTPTLAGGLLFCRNNKGELVCLDHRPRAAADTP